MDRLRIMRHAALITIRDRSFVFWIVFFPMMMLTFFHLTFSNITDSVDTLKIPVAIEKGSLFNLVAPSIEILDVRNVSGEGVDEALRKNEISAYIDKNLNLTVDDNGTNEMIVKQILDQTKQTVKLGKIPSPEEMKRSYVETVGKKFAPWMLATLSMLALFTTYSSSAGVEVATMLQADQSYMGQRLGASPAGKLSMALIFSLVNLFIYLFGNILVLLFLRFVLGNRVITNFSSTLLLMTMGSLVGLGLGLMLGAFSRGSAATKTLFSTILSLFLAYLSGMMSFGVKGRVELSNPIMAKINPVALMVTEIINVNVLGKWNTFVSSIGILLLMFVVTLSISLVFLRRLRYDSI